MKNISKHKMGAFNYLGLILVFSFALQIPGTLIVRAQTPVVPPPPGPMRPGSPSEWGSIKEPVIKQVDRNTYQIDNIIVNKKERTITLPGEVNMQEGLVELLACGKYGKRHESVLVMPVEPYYMQIALLLLDLEPGKKKLRYQGDREKPEGSLVDIFVEWKDGTRTVRKRAEDLILDKTINHSMPKTNWVFTGSILRQGAFVAQIEQSLVTTYHDPATIIDNPLPGGGEHGIYFANNGVVPSVGTPVKVVIKAIKK